MYKEIGKINEAESDLLEALDINSESITANNQLAGLYLDLSIKIEDEYKEYRGSSSSKIDSYKKGILGSILLEVE